MNTKDSSQVTLARIVRPHGIRGEVAAEILTDFPERLTRLSSVELYDETNHTLPNGTSRGTVRSCRLTTGRGGQAIFHFEGFHSMDEARKLVGLEVRIPIADRIPLPNGSYYVTDLIGCKVQQRDGKMLGSIRDVDRIGEDGCGTPILVVDSSSGEILIPLAQDICVEVDIPARRITVDLPEGLSDLNSRA